MKKRENVRENENKKAENRENIRKSYKICAFYIDIFQKKISTNILKKLY